MISLRKAESLFAGSYMAERKMIIFLVRYFMPALMILPAFANSMLTLQWLVVLLDVVCIRDGLACEI